jgi:DNA-binding winged helix-turn-helix (wHTH) protein/TolB-like protein
LDANSARAYRFAGFSVDLAQRRLVSARGGSIPLSGRAYDVLVFLIEHRERVVSKDELLKAVWPRTIVEENNLNQAVSTLRRALGDSRETPQYILTVAGRGYRFIAIVDEQRRESSAPAALSVPVDVPAIVATAPPTTPAQPVAPIETAVHRVDRRWALVALGAAALAAAGVAFERTRRHAAGLPRSIAVLPFKPLVASASDQAVELGIAESLISALSELPGVAVSPLSSVRRYSAVEQDPLAAGRELGVDAVVDGYVQIRPGVVRMTARLLDVGTGVAIWSGRFDEKSEDFFSIQDSIASELVSVLAINLTGAARERLLKRDTQDIEAWKLYVNGRYHIERRNEADLRRAVGFFEAAERADPQFALAAAGLADAWAILGVFGIEPPAIAFPRAQAAAERALAIDPRQPEALGSLGHVLLQYRRDWRRGKALYDRALEIKPGFVQGMIWQGLLCTMQTRPRDGLRWLQEAQTIEPMSLAISTLIGFVQYFARDYDASHEQLARIVASAPEADLARSFLARTLLRRDPAAALELVGNRDLKVPGGFGNVGRALALLGDRERTAAEIARLEELGRHGFGVAFDLAAIHLDLGDRKSALAWLERAVDDDSQMMLYLDVEPLFDPLRDEPRFRAVSRRFGISTP